MPTVVENQGQEEAAGLSATNISRLTREWEEEYRQFQQRRFDDRDYVYVWADGVHFNVRLEDDRLCPLVLLGARQDGTKELLAVVDGYAGVEFEDGTDRSLVSPTWLSRGSRRGPGGR